MLAAIGLWFAKHALLAGDGLKSFWTGISPRAKLIVLGVVALVVGGVGHHWYAGHQLKVQYKAGYAQAEKDIAAHALKLKAQVDGLTKAVAADERKKNDQANARVDAHANTIRVQGPGRAVCPGSPAPADGRQPQSGPVNAGLDRVPYPEWQQLLAVPFDDTISFAKQCDINTEEVKSWHSWYGRLVTAWPKAK